MKADFSRNTFRPHQHYRDVLKQQGRVDVDADWNEQQAINVHRTETQAVDVIGRTGAPLHAAGFAITADGQTLRIGAGRYYVDGILCENDRERLDYREQPDRRDLTSVLEELKVAKATTGIVYLDVWLRHITALNDPLIREVALGGPDTATRTQVVWQVRVLPIPSTPVDRERLARAQARRAQLQQQLAPILATGGDASALILELVEVNREIAAMLEAASNTALTCDSRVAAWDQLTAASAARLNARTSPTPPTTDLCELPPRAGYQRTENQLYRVEVHHGGTIGQATFKWSRDNGSVATTVEEVSGSNLTVGSVGRDEVLGFAANQWVELIDDATELAGGPGHLMQIEQVPSGSRRLTMKTTPPAIDRARRPVLRRWDQVGQIASANGVTITGEWQSLEDGVEVQFSKGPFRTGDYWLIPARTATGDVEWPPFESPNDPPLAQPPLGIRHHFSRLAIVRFEREALTVLADCRKIFPPLTEISAPPAPPVQEAMHVKGTNWRNDAPLAMAEFADRGLIVDFDERPEPASLSLKTMIVTLELPIVPETGFEPTSREVAPRLSVILFGEISVNDNQVRWLPLRGNLQSLATFFRGVQQVIGRVTLKGAVIWSKQDNRLLYLDGATVGEPTRDPNSEALRTELRFPSGRGERSSDFESWFLLTLPAGLRGLTIAPANVRMLQRANNFFFAQAEGPANAVEVVGTLQLSGPATADVVVTLNRGESRELVQAPDTVTIRAGESAARFPIAPGRRGPDGTERVVFTANLGGTEFSATLTVGRG